MFSLIITIIAIALVAALALATLYYGGDAFNEGRAAAHAAMLRTQGQQLVGAAELFYAREGRWNDDIPELVSRGYLTTEPQAKASMSEALAATPWTMPAARVPVFVLEGVGVSACRKVNEGTYGLPGILAGLRLSYSQQCYGSGTSALKLVAARGGAALQRAAEIGDGSIALEDVSSAPLPDASAEAEWLVSPLADSPVAEPIEPVEPSGPAVLSTNLASLSFGAQAVNTAETLLVTLQNTGGTAASFAMAPFLSGHHEFSVVSTTCGLALEAGASCTVSINFAPSVVDTAYAGTLTFFPVGADALNVGLSGSAIAPVTLVAGTVPQGTTGVAYTPFSFATFLQVANGANPDLGEVQWSLMSGTIPAGMTFSLETGVLSGTPTNMTSLLGNLVSVRATYQGYASTVSYRIPVKNPT